MKSHFLKKKLQPQSINSSMESGEKKKKSENCSPHTAGSGTYWNSPSRGKCSVNQWQRKCVILSHIASFADDRRMQNCIKMQMKWHIWGRKWGRQTDPEVILMSHVAAPPRFRSREFPPFLIIIVRVCLSTLRQLPHVRTAADTRQ